ncbi:uncharacterized protein LOC116210372 isoform X2 [Punica granatum]|uniref:Uncharacterized protein LOC116210372 isoform X2 n=3 Tax=Punica granatum TaxID=22663 RepID=A0A6P8E3T9_PUNGR|nr:uncharacterized protein LOC116210372 isoform X2 [Punica granatum]PKI65099.1 hypothetical protein CRG98_014568 [Punica granatum]
MAGLHSPTCSFSTASMELTSISSLPNPRAVLASPVAVQKPSRLTRRKNHLRPKILKTLSPNPTPSPVTVAAPLIIHENQETLTHYDVEDEASSAELSSAAETHEVDEFHTASSVAEESLDLGKFSTKSVLKFGAYFVGLFLFQTICAVWFLGSASSSSSTEKPDGSESSVDEKDRVQSLINGNVRRGFTRGKVSSEMGDAALYLGEAEMQKKIEEIRLMAREARRSERKNLEGEAEGGETEEEESASKSRIAFEKEIGTRLNKLQKGLNSVKKYPVSSNGVSGPKEVGSDLVFKKKLKFRGTLAGKNSQGPKGFSSENHSPAATQGNSNSQELRRDGIDFENGAKGSVPRKEMEFTKSKTGPLQKSSQERSSVEVVNSGTSREVIVQNSRIGGNKGSAKKSASPSMTRQKDDTARFWWLNLPCVFAILMRRASNSEGPEGLFTVKIASDEDDKSISSYVVAFEDRVDANNFCYLLESFFEELGDFSADIVPLLRKELEEAVKTKNMKIFVLRKGQLRLYAGQPFSDVESDLMSLVKENQSVYR